MSGALKSEAEMLATLRDGGAYTLSELYRRCGAECDIERDDGLRPPGPRHATDTRWKRRLRGKLMNLKRSGHARALGHSCWLIQGDADRPAVMVLLAPGAHLEEIELRVQDATELLLSLEEPCDVVMSDPPYGLGFDTDRSPGRKGHYNRNENEVLSGYVDVDPAHYQSFTSAWVSAAAMVLRPAGQLVVVTGPQRAAHVQIAGEEAGLTWVCSIAARHYFVMPSKHRPSPAHWTVTVLCRGRLGDRRRVFNPPPDLPRSRAGNLYPLDFWEDNGRSDRPGRLRNTNELPLKFTRRLVLSFTNQGEHLVDPMLGGGTFAIPCWEHDRRFTGADINPKAVQYTAARLLTEHTQPHEHAERNRDDRAAD
jgi:DNA modification methylase